MSYPVLGILTLYLNDNKQLEERPVYQSMIIEGAKLGLDIYIFTPMDVNDTKKNIYALMYDPERKKWYRKWRDFPDMIYDRCRIQHSHRFQQLLEFRKTYNHLLFLNRPLRNKWTIHEVLSKRADLRKHLPETKMFKNLSDAKAMLKSKSILYLKPVNGTGGRGILRIEKLKGSSNHYYVQGRNQQRKIITPQKVHSARLGSILHTWNMKDRYLIQEGIPVELPNGRVHDYRMLVQKNKDGAWALTGIAGRVGAMRSVTSNLHGGGKAVSMDILLAQWIPEENKRLKVKQQAKTLGLETAAYLEATYGALCELALDLAINKNGDVYLLEVNPKPAREVFAKSGQKNIYRRAIITPLEYALWVYHRKKSPPIPEEKEKKSEKEESE
ncbi:glutathione synthase/RimK-type ligase-like ATP-grasp enzyme [Paenibacillus sp. DS2015]|uniref:YheC/YheD family endospore coat-associated protein n=1 Tax=Paenibacillus sp. DS2015 TaxID=3373917 RepID=UPI003D25A914